MFLETSRGKYGGFILSLGVRGCQRSSEAVRGRQRTLEAVRGYYFEPLSRVTPYLPHTSVGWQLHWIVL